MKQPVNAKTLDSSGSLEVNSLDRSSLLTSHLNHDRQWRLGTSFVPPTRSPVESQWLEENLPELLEVERLIQLGGDEICYRLEATIVVSYEATIAVSYKGVAARKRVDYPVLLPLYAVFIGRGEAASDGRGATLMTAGMHGIERIGTQVLLGFLKAILERRRWDGALNELLQQSHWILIPILNPGGMLLNWRSNPNGVDLNRNAPIDAQQSEAQKPLWMGGGQTFSANLPWFRGFREQGLEVENKALKRLMIEDLSDFNAVLALDLHSGFGGKDRLWFPYAYRRRPIDTLPEFMALKLLWEGSFPPEAYQFEPQSAHYLAHGDMWDYLYREMRDKHDQRLLPLTLEMGSWRWLKKRPLHVFRRLGLFHPLVPRRVGRACRDHYSFLMFMLHAAAYMDTWLPERATEKAKTRLSNGSRKELKAAALTLWYPELL